MKIAVIGSGSWGTALAVSLCANHHDVTLWAHRAEAAERIRLTRLNPRLPGVTLPEDLEITSDPACVTGCGLVVMAPPSYAIRAVSGSVAPFLSQGTPLVSVTKGIESGTLLRMSQIIEAETHHPVAALTGPSYAEEVARKIPTGCVAACPDKAIAELVQDAFMSDFFRVYTSADIVGAELGGALKNTIALCAGISDGLGFGDNTRAMLMTRGLTEIARLGLSLGADKDTFTGLAGAGDLIVTCTSMHSRNHRAGILIGQGMAPEDAMKQIGAVVEGYYATKSAWELCQAANVEMPIIRGAYRVLYEHTDPRSAVHELLVRQRKAESEYASWQ